MFEESLELTSKIFLTLSIILRSKDKRKVLLYSMYLNKSSTLTYLFLYRKKKKCGKLEANRDLAEM